MKPFHFPLDPVLRLKKQLLNQAERKLAAAAAEKQRIERMIEEWKREIVDANSQFKTQSSSSADATWHNALRRVAALEQQIADEREQLSEATQIWRTVRDDYRSLASETETIEKMRASQWHAYLLESENEEQRELDELVLQRIGRRDQKLQNAETKVAFQPKDNAGRNSKQTAARRIPNG